MLFHLIKKNILVLLRNAHVLIVLLVMPVALICILGFALSGMMEDETSAIKAKVYIVEEGSEKEELQTFIEEVSNSSTLPDEAKEAITGAAPDILPISVLKNKVLKSAELKESIELLEGKVNEMDAMKEDDEAAVIIEVPEQFTYGFLQYMFFQKGEIPSLTLAHNEGKQIAATMIEGIVESFQEQYAYSSFLQKEQLVDVDLSSINSITVDTQTVNEVPSVNSATYYTIGMSTMFVLYIATNLASFSFREKEMNLYSRILLGNVSPWSYLGSSFITGMVLAFIQMCLLFAVSVLLYDVSIPSLSIFIGITCLLSFGVGGLTALLTALNFRFNKESISEAFGNIVVTFMAFIGGSYIPISTFPEWFQTLGGYSLNGAGLKAYMSLMQEYDWAFFSDQLLTMFIYGILLLLVSVFIFPRKGEA